LKADESKSGSEKEDKAGSRSEKLHFGSIALLKIICNPHKDLRNTVTAEKKKLESKPGLKACKCSPYENIHLNLRGTMDELVAPELKGRILKI
jgi:hypothetical protein